MVTQKEATSFCWKNACLRCFVWLLAYFRSVVLSTLFFPITQNKVLHIHCVQKAYNHVFENKLNENCLFAMTFVRFITCIFSFTLHLFSAATLPWETVET